MGMGRFGAAAAAVEGLATDAHAALSDAKEQVRTAAVIGPAILGAVAAAVIIALVLSVVAVARRD